MSYNKESQAYKNQLKAEREKYHRWRANGCCVKCGVPVTKYKHCIKHRLIAAENKRKYHAKTILNRLAVNSNTESGTSN